MKCVKYTRKKIAFKEFEDKLNVKIKKIEIREDHLKLSLDAEPVVCIYLLCQDIKDILQIKENLFGYEHLSVKGRFITYGEDDELFRGRVEKWIKNGKR